MSRHEYVWCGVLLHFPPSSRFISQTGIVGIVFLMIGWWFPCLFAQHKRVSLHLGWFCGLFTRLRSCCQRPFWISLSLINSTCLMIGGLFIYKRKRRLSHSALSCLLPPFLFSGPRCCLCVWFSAVFLSFFNVLWYLMHLGGCLIKDFVFHFPFFYLLFFLAFIAFKFHLLFHVSLALTMIL